MIDPALYAKASDFRYYVKCRKLEDYNRNSRRSIEPEVGLYFANLFLKRVRELEEEYPDFRETFDKMEERKS